MKNHIIIQADNFNAARKKIRENKDKKIIFSCVDDELNRKVMEKENIDILLLNQLGRKDYQKQRNSGFNQVLAKIAKKKGISIGINLDEIIISKSNEKIQILARVRQNIKLCNKNKIKMRFISEKVNRDKYDIKALGVTLGMPSNMIKSL